MTGIPTDNITRRRTLSGGWRVHDGTDEYVGLAIMTQDAYG